MSEGGGEPGEDDPTKVCQLCNELWHSYRTGEDTDLEELRLVHRGHVKKDRQLAELRAALDEFAAILEARAYSHLRSRLKPATLRALESSRTEGT